MGMFDSEERVKEFPSEDAEGQPEDVDEEHVAEEEVATPSSSAVKRSGRGRKRAAATAASAPASVADLPSAPETRAIESIYGGRVIAGPAPSGATYDWPEAGSVVQVAADDVGWVLAKNGSIADQCCGSGGPPVYFHLAD